MIYRIDVHPRRGDGVWDDPQGVALRHQIHELGLRSGPIATSRIFLIDIEADAEAVKRIADELLADPVVETAEIVKRGAWSTQDSRIEVHLKPGVMDPVAASTEMAIRDHGHRRPAGANGPGVCHRRKAV